MSLIRISESDNWIVDYDRERGMYKVSYFEDGHFVDQCRFDCFDEREYFTKYKVCKYWKQIREDRWLCKHPTFTLDDDTIDPLVEANDFCSYGEYKNG